FRDALQDAGCDCSFIIQEKKGSLEDYYKNISKQYVAKVRDWVKDMPKPVGVMATDDKCGCIVCEACRLEKINVPGQVSVIGVNNDVIRCLFNEPAVSSIDLNFEGIGYRAAEILDQWISGKDYSGEIIQVPPLNVVERLSSTTLGLDDENLRLALSFMRSNFTRNISLDDVAKAGRLSRAVLTRRFHSVLGLTVADEIRRLRLERAEKLLLETDLSLDTIAYETGFKHARYFSDVFRKQNGIPPGQWRKKNALRYPDMSSLSG
ncbi:MAG: helix-turn-helix domain-containing protein, partial [Candidatus Sumerlaeia bacterium]